MAVKTNVIGFEYDTAFEVARTAASFVLCNRTLDNLILASPQAYCMFYQSSTDSAAGNVSLFAYDTSKQRAVHESVPLKRLWTGFCAQYPTTSEVNTLPINQYTHDRRAFLRADNIVQWGKWLKTCPKACNIYMAFEVDDADGSTNRITFTCANTGKSNKSVPDLVIHAEHEAKQSDWIPNFRRPFNHARSAFINMSNSASMHEFTALLLDGLDAKLISEAFGSDWVVFVPFHGGSMCYVKAHEKRKYSVEMVFASGARVNRKNPEDV